MTANSMECIAEPDQEPTNNKLQDMNNKDILLPTMNKQKAIPSASIDTSRVYRNILADRPRVTRFLIDWE